MVASFNILVITLIRVLTDHHTRYEGLQAQKSLTEARYI